MPPIDLDQPVAGEDLPAREAPIAPPPAPPTSLPAAAHEPASAPSSPLGAFPDLWIVLALVGLAVIPFLSALTNLFVWHDAAVVVNSPVIRSVGNAGAVFSRPFLMEPEGPSGYHPLATLTYLMDYQVWGLSPEGYHSGNLTVHLIATMLVYALALHLLRRRSMAFATAAIFAVHPVHVQSVAWISGRPCMLATCFVLLAMLAYGAYVNSFGRDPVPITRRRVCYTAAVLAFALGLFAHGAAGVLILLLPLYERWLAPRRIAGSSARAALLPYLGFLIALGVYLVARRAALGYDPWTGVAPGLWPNYLYGIPNYAVRALASLWVPIRSNLYAPVELPTSPLSLGLVTSIAALAVVIAMATRLRGISAPLAFALWWTILALGVTLNWLPLPDAHFEHNLYLASVGSALMLGWLGVSLHDYARRAGARWRPWLVRGAFAVALALGMWASWVRTTWYHDDVTFFSAMARLRPPLALPHFNLGSIYLLRGDPGRAIEEFRAAVAIRPSFEAYHYLGESYLATGRYGEAVTAYRRALTLAPSSAPTMDGLRRALDEQRRHGESPTPTPPPGDI